MENINNIKDIVTLITLFLTLILSFSKTYTFLTASTFERQLFSKEGKFLFTLIMYLSLVSSITFLFYIWLNEFVYFNQLIENVNIYIILIFMVLFISLVLRKLLPNKIKQFIFTRIPSINNIKNKIKSAFWVTYLLLYLILIGSFNTFILLDGTNLNERIVTLVIFIIIEILIFHISTIFGRKTNINDSISVIIKLDNDDIFENYYIYNLTKNKFLQIGKEDNSYLCEDPILIPMSRIVYCQKYKSS